MGMMDYLRSSYDLGPQFTNIELQTKEIEDCIGGTMFIIGYLLMDICTLLITHILLTLCKSMKVMRTIMKNILL